MSDAIPRRIDTSRHTPAEQAIRAAMAAVEAAGAHPLLTDAVTLRGKACDAVADFVDFGPAHGVTFGETGYRAYAITSGGKSLVSGQQLPAWSEVSPEIRAAWESAALAIRSAS